jgi:hypothetical protein
MLFSVGYVGNRMTHSMAPINLNASVIDGQGPLSAAWGRTADTLQLQGYLNSHYNALQVTIDRNFSKGLYLKGAYTYSKAIDYATEGAWGGSEWMPPAFAGPGYLEHNRGMADFDHRHIFRLGYVWELPFGTGQRFANSNAVGRAILGGWQLNGVWSSQSGAPTGMYGDALMQQTGNLQSLDQLGPISKVGCKGPGTDCYWYDPSAFAPVPETCLNANCILPNGLPETPQQHRFGTAGRNIAVYGPARMNLDAGLTRHFKLSERFDLQFKAIGLNVLNHPTWNWDGTLWGNGYCTTTSSGRCTGFLKTNSASGHRQFQLGLRLSF